MKRALVLAVLLIAASPARADDWKWYGWQIMLADSASVLLTVAGAPEAAVVPHLVGGPTVHLFHKNYWRSGISLGMRFALPYALYKLEPCEESNEFCGLGGLLLGVGISLVADWVMAIDVRSEAPPPPPPISVGVGVGSVFVRGTF